MEIIRFLTGPLKVNTFFLVYAPGKAAVIDPGGNEKWLLAELAQRGLAATHILLSHGHFDHIGAVGALHAVHGSQICIHRLDAPMLTQPFLNLSAEFGKGITAPAAQVLWEGCEDIALGEHSCRVLHTPGHTEGGVCYFFKNALFTGDTLFHASIGRTDFPGGNYKTLVKSIREQLFTLPDCPVYPGHEEFTTLAEEKEDNPFLGFGWNG